MKKIIIAVVVLLAILGVTAPYLNGMLMEKSVRQALANANTIYAESNTDYSLEIISYKRNFYTSDIEWKVNFGSLKNFYGIEEMIFSDHAKHGYTGVVSTTNFEKNKWFQNFIDNKLQGKNPFQVTTTYSLPGNMISTISMQAFSIDIEGETLAVEEGKFTVGTDISMKNFSSTGSWKGAHAGEKFKLDGINMDAEMEMISTFLWDGKMDFSIDTLLVDEDKAHLSWTDFNASYTSTIDQVKNTISTAATFAVDNVDTRSVNIPGAKATFTLKNMDAQGYEEFMDVYTKSVSEVVSQAAALENDPVAARKVMEQRMGQIGLQAVSAFEKLLQAGLEIQFSDVQVQLPEGDIKGDVTLRLLKDMSLMQFAPVVGQPDLILDILYLKSDIQLPESFAATAPTLTVPIYPGMPSGFFVQEEGLLHHQAETRDHKLYLNDKEVELKRL